MLLIFAFSLVIASVFLIIYRKNKDSILWLGLCTSLMLELCGVMLFIAKKGGISQEVLTFLYFSRNIYRKMQYFNHIRQTRGTVHQITSIRVLTDKLFLFVMFIFYISDNLF